MASPMCFLCISTLLLSVWSSGTLSDMDGPKSIWFFLVGE